VTNSTLTPIIADLMLTDGKLQEFPNNFFSDFIEINGNQWVEERRKNIGKRPQT